MKILIVVCAFLACLLGWFALFVMLTDLVSSARMEEIAASWETMNKTWSIRINQHMESGGPVPGAYYVFQCRPEGSSEWREIMTFRHDDSVDIPRDQVRFVDDQIGYVFMGWMYAVTTDGGVTWSVWDARKDLPGWKCCNYGLIQDVRLEPDGPGMMVLKVIDRRRGEVPRLFTENYGRRWSTSRP